MKRLQAPASVRLKDADAEKVNRDHTARITELQQLPCASLAVIANRELADGVETPITHNLGRAPLWVRESCVRGAVTTGRIEEVRPGKYDRTKVVILKATGWGATVTIDLAVL